MNRVDGFVRAHYSPKMRLESAKLVIIAFEVFLLLIVLGVLVFDELTSTLKYAPIVHLNEGQVRGIVQDVDPGLQVFLYQGIFFLVFKIKCFTVCFQCRNKIRPS